MAAEEFGRNFNFSDIGSESDSEDDIEIYLGPLSLGGPYNPNNHLDVNTTSASSNSSIMTSESQSGRSNRSFVELEGEISAEDDRKKANVLEMDNFQVKCMLSTVARGPQQRQILLKREDTTEFSPSRIESGSIHRTSEVISMDSFMCEVAALSIFYRNLIEEYLHVEDAASAHRVSANKADELNKNDIFECRLQRHSGFRLTSRNVSEKVFLGGLPFGCTKNKLLAIFGFYGKVRAICPDEISDSAPNSIPKGYCYLVYTSPSHVVDLLTACSHRNGSYYYHVLSKEVQIVPWQVTDAECSLFNHGSSRRFKQPLPSRLTVFVGALHGLITAQMLFNAFDRLFGNVVHAAIDMDTYRYPVGSGRISFCCEVSFLNAVQSKFVRVIGDSFTKTIQVDPYLEDSLCKSCGVSPGVYFCRDLNCFTYFCPYCWDIVHCSLGDPGRCHTPLRRAFWNSIGNQF